MSNLTTEQLEWLARHWVALNEFVSDAPPPASLNLHRFFIRANGVHHYEFSDYDEAVEAQIRAKRKALGLE